MEIPAVEELRGNPLRACVLGLCLVGAVAHQATHWSWFIDDAAICFTYARNLANGLGGVPWPGGERIEAVSDPSWVAVLTAFQLVGLDGFTVAKPLAVAFGLVTVVTVWRTARLALPDHRGPGALIAPAALAINPQFAIWSASGLENALFFMLLSLAIHRAAVEARGDRRPASAIFFLLLAWTRPEGILYAAAAAIVLVATRFREAGGPRWLATWAAIVALPSAALEAARIAYFAWPVANTYYAKIESRGVYPFEWDRRGWTQLREWADRLWYGYWTPVYALGVSGTTGWRPRVGLCVIALCAASLLWPGTDDLQALALWPHLPAPPEAWRVARIGMFFAAGAGLPLLALGTAGGIVRLLVAWTAALALAFGVYAEGDWMGAYRWMSFAAAPLSVLFAVGMTSLLDWFEANFAGGGASWGPATWLAASLGVGLQIPPAFSQTRDHLLFNHNETTASVKLRVDYTRSIARKTFWDGPIENVDVDMGAHLWWAPDYRELDMAMLVDIPIGRHWFQQRPFVHEYFFEEHRPTFAMVGGWWASHSGLRRYPEWDERMFELPGYQNTVDDYWFRNVFAARELVMTDAAVGGARTDFGGDLALAGLSVPTPWVAGQPGYLEAPLELTGPREHASNLRVVAFLADGDRVVGSWALPLGYGIYPLEQWKPGQIFRGRFAVPVPAGLAPGRYDLGFVVSDPGGVIAAATTPPAPRFAHGEAVFPSVVEVVDAGELNRRISQARADLSQSAHDGDCERAEARWILLQRHRPVAWNWHDELRSSVGTEIADCWAERARVDPGRAVEHLAAAHRWDPYDDRAEQVGGPLATQLVADGREAMDQRDWQTAYRRFADVLSFSPERPEVRKLAEQARDQRLGIANDVRINIGGDDDLRAVEEQKAKGGAPK